MREVRQPVWLIVAGVLAVSALVFALVRIWPAG